LGVARLAATVLAALAITAVAPSAHASKASRWDRVLRDHHVTRDSHRIVVRPGHVGARTVSVRIAARASNPDPVVFPDPLFGATAWHWDGRRWRRIDSAEVRPAVVQQLEPGQRARVRLPLRRRPARIRVLVPVTADHAGAWVDVLR
jgi:hypothetical protein